MWKRSLAACGSHIKYSEQRAGLVNLKGSGDALLTRFGFVQKTNLSRNAR